MPRVTHYKSFPFSAIVGQEDMKLALLLNAINPKIGGVLIKGTKGTAKSTAVRALADLLPEIRVIKECPFNCNPDSIKESCHSCQHKLEDGEIGEDGIDLRKMRVINLPINATEDRVVGTINIEDALRNGLKALEPGILAEANRNILYIDEVNLLSDSVADVLLDSAAMGINIIEREGISLHHPSNFILIGTMNPEEGNLRPQLLDRFGLGVDAEAINGIDDRVEIVRRAEDYHADPVAFYGKYEAQQGQLRNRIADARALLPRVRISDELLKRIAAICVAFEVDGHRADITINITAKTLAAFNGRVEVSIEDVKRAARLALNHRLRRLPFEDKKVDESKIDQILEQASGTGEQDPPDEPAHDADGPQPDSQPLVNLREATFGIGKGLNADKVVRSPKSREVMNASGRVVPHPTSDKRGKQTGDEKQRRAFNVPTSTDIAILPTINEAALDPANRAAMNGGGAIQVNHNHIHVKKRLGKSSYAMVFCVDASGSMGASDRMEAVKAAIFSILQGSYVRRDKVSLVVFRQDAAEVVLPPTRSVDLAFKLLKSIPTGGTTPLAAGLLKAVDVAQEERRKETGYIPIIILITDARANVYVNDAIDDAKKVGRHIAELGLEAIVIDTEPPGVRIGLAREIADAARAAYYPLDQLGKDQIRGVLRSEGMIDLAGPE
ncbi:MAG: magnesium chelatase subunit D family protein [Candidatus Lokiarchaeota archaeon]|nr:magnesium chelatase subunit D family protein [Candidatus Lokiarchaeota archaeon]